MIENCDCRNEKTDDNSCVRSAIDIRRVDRMLRKPQLVLYLVNNEKQGTTAELEIDFQGQIFENSNGLFKGKVDRNNLIRYF